MRGPGSVSITHTHTQELVSSQGEMSKSPEVCSIEEEESEASHAPVTGASTSTADGQWTIPGTHTTMEQLP